MKDKDERKEQLAKAGAGVATGVLGIAATPTALGAAAGIAGAVVALFGAVDAWQKEKIARLLQEAYFENAADEGFAAIIADLLQRPRVRRVFLESVRTALESIADEVLPAVGALMREYERTDAEADAKFRGLCRVLQELSSEEYASLRGLFRRASADSKLLGSRAVSFVRAVDPVAGTEEVVVAGVQPDDNLYLLTAEECDPRHFPRLSHLMYVHNIGSALGHMSVTLTGKDVEDELRIGPATVTWVARFLVK